MENTIKGFHQLLESSFIYYIVGKPGSGKTSLVKAMLNDANIYKNKFSKIILISPYNNIQNDEWLNKLDMKTLWEALQGQQNKQNVLIILDDAISQINKFKNNVDFQNLIFNRRNIIPGCIISLIITSQKYVLLPCNIRSCVSMLFFFRMFGNDLQRIRNEWIADDEQKQLLNRCIEKQQEFQFISIRLNPYQITLNFDLQQSIEQLQNQTQKIKVKAIQIPKEEKIIVEQKLEQLKTIQPSRNVFQQFERKEQKENILQVLDKNKRNLNSLYNML